MISTLFCQHNATAGYRQCNRSAYNPRCYADDDNTMAKPNPRNPVHLLAAGFGSGLAPRAPGTFGTLAALPLWWLLHYLSWSYYALCVIGAFVLGIFICDKTARDLRVHDHGAIVWDEFVGLWIALACVPMQWPWILAGFLLFRLFDIWKPWPIRWCDRHIRGGFGIMFDDVLAGALALAVLQTSAALLR
jgi:phosphatidylglycerophosphatase A